MVKSCPMTRKRELVPEAPGQLSQDAHTACVECATDGDRDLVATSPRLLTTDKRNSMNTRILACAVSWAMVVCATAAADWPQYFGPHRNGTSDQKGLLRTWPANGPAVLWTVPVGKGFGGPVVTDGKVYLLDRDDKVGDTLRCLDLSTGKELWQFAYDAPGTAMFPGPRSVPTVDGNHVYSCGRNGDLYCIEGAGRRRKRL